MLLEESARNINTHTHIHDLELRSVSRRLANTPHISRRSSNPVVIIILHYSSSVSVQSQSSQDALGDISAVRFLGQILILLQYQTLAHRMKVMVRKAENLAKLTRMPGTPGLSEALRFLHYPLWIKASDE